MVVTVVFFFWPALKSLQLSLFRVSPFGDRMTFVGLDNFTSLFADYDYYVTVLNSFVFAGGVTVISVSAALVAAGLATQKIRGLAAYPTLPLRPHRPSPSPAPFTFP